jgi:hypothetical protein
MCPNWAQAARGLVARSAPARFARSTRCLSFVQATTKLRENHATVHSAIIGVRHFSRSSFFWTMTQTSPQTAAYGVLKDDWVIILANSIGATLSLAVLGYKIRDLNS